MDAVECIADSVRRYLATHGDESARLTDVVERIDEPWLSTQTERDVAEAVANLIRRGVLEEHLLMGAAPLYRRARSTPTGDMTGAEAKGD